MGWYRSAPDPIREHANRYLRVPGENIGWDLIRSAYSSVSSMAVIPLQDFMSLGSAARFNTPGKPQGNWQWRFCASQLAELNKDSSAYIRELAELNGRLPESTD